MWILLLLGATGGDPWPGRTEGAAVRVRLSALALAETSTLISTAGRIERLAPLRSEADELVRHANLLVRWAQDPPDGE